jgi:hypothetical protein
VESGNHLGIYWGKNKATLVCLAPPGRERKILDCFSVTVEGEQQGQQALADRVVQACRERRLKFSEVAVALDCASFMQHRVHSEFSDPKRIAATIRFDTEESLATDISEMAVSFRIVSSGEDGAQLDVFTAQRAVLSDILLSLQSHGIDPVAVDPDVCCLARCLAQYGPTPEAADRSTLYALLSDSRGYLVATAGAQKPSVLRTFLIGATQDRTGLLLRETLVTTGLAQTGHPVGRLCVLDAADGLRPESLQERTGLPVNSCDLSRLGAGKTTDTADPQNAVDVALACGAALGSAEKADSVNLRNDHMPYLGKKRRVQRAICYLSLGVTMLLLSVGVYFHSQLIRVDKQREGLRDVLEADYLPVMPGEKMLPTPMSKAVEDLKKTYRRLLAEKTGANQGSISAMLELVLRGFNACAKETDLNIKSITITANTIIIDGDTSSPQNTQKAVQAMREIMKKDGIIVGSERVNDAAGRNAFSITAEPPKRTKGV